MFDPEFFDFSFWWLFPFVMIARWQYPPQWDANTDLKSILLRCGS